MSHPRAPGSEEEIPGGRDEAPGRSPRVPWNARFPEAKGGPAALPCGVRLSRLLRRGEGWELRAVCPQLQGSCRDVQHNLGSLHAFPASIPLAPKWPKPWEPPPTAPEASQPNTALYNPFFIETLHHGSNLAEPLSLITL